VSALNIARIDVGIGKMMIAITTREAVEIMMTLIVEMTFIIAENDMVVEITMTILLVNEKAGQIDGEILVVKGILRKTINSKIDKLELNQSSELATVLALGL